MSTLRSRWALLALGLLPLGCHEQAERAPPSSAPAVAAAFYEDSSKAAASADADRPAISIAKEPPDDDGDEPSRPRKPGEWIAALPSTPGLLPKDFAVIAQPSADHPQGMVAALAYNDIPRRPEQYLVRIDVASGKELGRRRVGPPDASYITSTRDAIVLGTQTESALEVAFVDFDGQGAQGTRTLRGVGTGEHGEVRQFQGFDDRIVVVTGGYELTTVHLLDEKGAQLSTLQCRGGLVNPGHAELERRGDEVVLWNLISGQENDPAIRLCSFLLHGAPRLQEVRLPYSGTTAARGEVYYFGENGFQVLDQHLRPGALEDPPDQPSCWGLTGTARWKVAEAGENRVIWMVACCGDTGGGMFICRPPHAIVQ